MNLLEVMSKELVSVNIDLKSKEEVIDYLCTILESEKRVKDKELFEKAVYRRETIGKTGMGDGIAIPHGLSSQVIKPSIAMVKVSKAIMWESLDGQPVDLIFMIAVPKKGDNQSHIKILSELASILAYEQNVMRLRELKSKEMVVAELQKMIQERKN